MCIDAPESTTNPLSSGFVEDGPKASRMWLCPFLSASGHVSPFPTRLFGRIALVARFLPEICPQISEHRGWAHEVQNAELHLGMHPLSPKFLRGVMYHLRSARCAFVPRNVGPSVK